MDLIRGLVMVLMALDHVRGYFNFHYACFDPMDVKQGNWVVKQKTAGNRFRRAVR